MKLRNKDVLLVPILIVAGKLFSFLFNALLGSYYGAGKISDAFIMAHTIPTILFDGVATAFISCYIPIQRTLKHESPEKIDDFNSNMTSISFLLSLVITIIYFIFQRQINRFYGNGFDDASLGLLNGYTSIILWSIPFIGAYAIFRAHLQVSGKKTISSIGQVSCYLLLIIAVVVFYPHDQSLAWATLAGNIFCFVVFLVAAYRTGYRYRLYISFNEQYIKTLLVMIFPIFFSTLASELASIVDKYFASQHSDGIVTSLTYGYQLSFAIQGIISTSLLIVVFPSLADRAARKDEEGMNNVIYTCIDIVCWVVLPLVVGGAVISEPIISILFGHGNFTSDSVRITSVIFTGYLLGVLPMCVKHIGDRTCFALKKTNYSMITTFITVGLNVILDYVMNQIWGYVGLVIATDIAILLGSITTFVLIRREDKTISYSKILKSLLSPSICCLAMGLSIWLLRTYIIGHSTGPMLEMLASIIVGMIVYFGIAVCLFRKQLLQLVGYFRK